MILRIFAIFACAAALFFAACTNSDDFLYNESESIFIDVSAEMAFSFDTISKRSKSDTLSPNDTLIFIANILPSKSIKIKRYLWTLDGTPLSYDFSFRSSIPEPGLHKIAFILETFLGDTLSDTLTLWISNPPILQDSVFIPAKGSQGIPTMGGVSFAWDAYDPDSLATLFYRFSIDGLIDTVLYEPNFTYWNELKPLTHYRWHVQAINEFGFVSDNTIDGNFFTSGGPNEGGITGFIDVSARDNAPNTFVISTRITLLDSAGNECYSSDVNGSSQAVQPFVISPLKAGKYRVAFNIPKYPDFIHDTLDLVISPNEVQELDTIVLRDTIPPRISFIDSNGTNEGVDTLDYADTLKFLVTDLGTLQTQKTIYAYLESELITEKVGVGDTITIVLPTTAKSWNIQQLDIVAIDASKNKAIHSFFIRPAESWIKTNESFTQVGPGKIDLFIIDYNPYRLDIKACTFIVNGTAYSGNNYSTLLCSYRLTTDKLQKGDNTILSIAEYSNGINYWQEWHITYTDEE